MKTGSSTPNTTNSKEGRVPNTIPAPGLPRDPQRVFGNAPAPTRSDSGTDDPQEKDNLAQASAPTSSQA